MNSAKKFMILHLVLAGSLSLLVLEAKADLEVSAGVEIHANADFYEPLAPQGEWFEVGPYGGCWRPRAVARDWRPYCEGHWVLTDCGWYWASDEPWGWACYHYGSWVDDPSYGWFWVPNIEWAPAWVEWRAGAGFVGWAPCAPRGVTVGPELFAFVDVNHFHDPIRRSAVVVNNAVFQQTTHLPEAKREMRTIEGRSRNIVINEGPSTATVDKATGRKENIIPVQQAVRQAPAPPNFKPATRETEPARHERPVEQPLNKPPVPPPGEQAPQKEDRGIQPSRPVQPPIDQPVRPPIDRPIQPPVERPVSPPREERPVSPPKQETPAIPKPKEDRPASPQKEERPANPPRQENPNDPRRDKDEGKRPENGGIMRAYVSARPIESCAASPQSI